MRGKLSIPSLSNDDNRITPAGAGKTDSVAAVNTVTMDHPRRCGENLQIQDLETSAIGSPPQVRGKQTFRLDNKGNTGITPAGAGKTYRSDDFRQCAEDHPRRCGENQAMRFGTILKCGSPPQVRGKHSIARL